MARKYVGVTAYSLFIFGTLIVIYSVFWTPSESFWRNSGSSEIVEEDWKFQEKSAYDRLMKYILHPGAPCKTWVALGGSKRANGNKDGDKVLCLEPGPGLGEDCIVYSFGIANEWSFDESIQEKFGCRVFAFDPSMNAADHQHSKGVWFYNMAVGDFDGEKIVGGQTWKVRTLETIAKQLGHRNRTIDVLKMDIEGAELAVLEDILANGLLTHVNHLCVEIHLLEYPHWRRVLEMLMRITAETGLRLFSTRNNTQMPFLQVPGFYGRYEQHYFEMAWYRN